jgi:GcrA cell cycle regulator
VRNAWCFDWSDAAIERLKALWAEGFSASECGKRMGVSRNSVIGKIHRLGLSGLHRRPREPGPRRRRRDYGTRRGPRTAPARLLETGEQVLSRPEPPSPPGRQYWRTLLDLKVGECRWPEGDRHYTFCGAPQAFGSYCAHHHALAHSRGSQKDYDQAAEQALAGKLFASRAGVDDAA